MRRTSVWQEVSAQPAHHLYKANQGLKGPFPPGTQRIPIQLHHLLSLPVPLGARVVTYRFQNERSFVDAPLLGQSGQKWYACYSSLDAVRYLVAARVFLLAVDFGASLPLQLAGC